MDMDIDENIYLVLQSFSDLDFFFVCALLLTQNSYSDG